MSLAEELAADRDLRPEAAAAPAAPAAPAHPATRVADVASIWGSERLGDLLAKVVGGCPEPGTVWEASAACRQLDVDLAAAHSLLRALYGRRFPELEALVRPGAAYAAVARALGCGAGGGSGGGTGSGGGVSFGGGLGGGAVAAALAPLLPPAARMVVSLAAATTRGRPLDDPEQELVTEVLDAEAGMTAARLVLGAFVEARMAAAAPELVAVLGAQAAARLVAAAGGLRELARTPACNVLAMAAGEGAAQQPGAATGHRINAGAAAAAAGLLACPTLLDAPLHLRRKVARLLAAKAVLAARVDASRLPPPGPAAKKILSLSNNNNNALHRNNNNNGGGDGGGCTSGFVPGQAGTALRQQVERRLRQLQAPPPPKEGVALSRPPPGVGLLGGSVGGGAGVYVGGGKGRRRGGRRARRQRRQRGQASARQRAAARLRLADVWTGAPRDADGCWGWPGGGAGGGGGGGAVGPGGVRAPPPDDRTKVRISRALQRRLAVERERCLGAGDALATPVPGTASSVAFSTVQGLEIVHPAAAAAEALPAGRGRYFADVGAC